MKKYTKLLKRILSVLLLIIIINLPVIFYYLNFKKLYISDKTSEWSSFGDYIGGISSLLNLFVTIIIAFLIYRVDKNRDLLNNKNENLRLKRQLQEQEYNQLSTKLFQIGESVANKPSIEFVQYCYSTIMYIRLFRHSRSHLFDFLESDVFNEVIESLKIMMSSCKNEEYEKARSELKNFYKLEVKVHKEFYDFFMKQ